jgi:D-amino peptidase
MEAYMKILIAADMEGISGVVHWDQVSSTHPEYTRFRRIMTGEVNAAIRGAFEAGADEITVTDGHGWSRNILIEELDTRARLNSGTPSPLSMVEGVDTGVDGVIFVGYHARIGSQNAILEHTWSDERVTNLWINGELFGEIGLNAAVCGHYGVPVIMISGDQTACAEAVDLFGALETVIVKKAHGRMAAECLTPQVAQEQIGTGAMQAVTRLREGRAPKPLILPPPISMAVDFVQSEMADKASLLPGAIRTGRRVEYSAQDMITIYSAFRALLALARG